MNHIIPILFLLNLEAHIVPSRGLPKGITECLVRECLQASTGVEGLKGTKMHHNGHAGQTFLN